MKIRFRKGILIAIISVVMVLLTVITSFALSFDYSGTGSSTTGGSGNLSNTSFSINTTDIDKLVIGYRFSVADKDGKIVTESYDVYNNSWSRYGITYDNYYAAKGQPSKKTWINGVGFNNDSKVSTLKFNRCASSSIDSTMPQKPSEIGAWLSKNSYNNADTLFKKCGRTTIYNGDRLIVEPLIQVKLAGDYCAHTPTELAVIGGKIYGYNKQINTFTEGTFSTLNNYVQKKFPNQLRTNSAQSKLWGAAPYLSSRALYSTVINNGYGVSIVNATEDSGIVTEQKYTVKYDANGGTGTMADSTATYGEPFKTRQNTFKRDHYKFIGWNEKADGKGTAWSIVPGTPNGGTYESGQSWTWTYTKDITLYAQWLHAPDVYYHINGGTLSSNSSYKLSGGWICNSNNTYFKKVWPNTNGIPKLSASSGDNLVFYDAAYFGMYKPGYKFVGWSTNAACDYGNYGSNATFTSRQDNINVDSVPVKPDKNGEIWLYAIWAPITVTHDVNIDSVYSNFNYFPANRFATYVKEGKSVSSNGITYKHNIDTSTLTIDGTSKTNTQTTFAYQYNTIKPKDKYYITLIYRGGNYSGANPYFVIDTGDTLGKYSTRNKVDVPLPTETNRIIKREITIAEGRSSWVFWMWANGKTTYEDYQVEVYITSNGHVTDLDKLKYGVFDNNDIYLHAYKETETGVNLPGNQNFYLALPAAQNIYNSTNYVAPQDFKTHPFSYTFADWDTAEDGSSSKITSNTPLTATDNHTIQAQYTKNKVNIKYDVGANDIMLKTDKYTVKQNGDSYLIQKDGHDYMETYQYNDTITVPDGSKLTRRGYTFAGWKNPLTNEIYSVPENGIYKNTISTVEKMFGYLADKNYTITLVAQWEPITYNIEFWTDIGPDGKYKESVTSSYVEIDKVERFRNDTNAFPFESSEFIKAINVADKMTIKFDEAKNLIANKYSFEYHNFNGWYAYSESADAYYIQNSQDINAGFWKNAKDITKNDTLFLFKDTQEIFKLSPIDGDTVRMFATYDYSNSSQEITPKPWTPFKYTIHYCGNYATDYKYKQNVMESECGVSGHGNKQFVYTDGVNYLVDVDNVIKYNNSDKMKPIFDESFARQKDFDLTKNQFIRNGYHLIMDKTWTASCKIDDIVKYYGKNTDGEYGWYIHSELAEFYYFADGEQNLVNLYVDQDNAKVYMHAIWEPNTYKVYYCGNGANGQTYGTVDTPDTNGSMFTYSCTNENCPNCVENKCQSGNYLDNVKWIYDGGVKKLYQNKFTKTGYTFLGWRAYDANTNKWYGYSESNDLGWYTKTKISKYYTFNDGQSVENLSTTKDGVIYMVAQWTPIPYYIIYNANGGTGSMPSGAYSKGLLNKVEENATLYYDTEYYLRANTFTYGTRSFSHWTISLATNSGTKWYGVKNNVIGWYNLSDFNNGSAEYVKFNDTVVKHDIIVEGDAFKNLVVESGQTLTAHAQWTDKTIVYYNTNNIKANLSYEFHQHSEKDILKGMFGSEKYSQIFSSNNSDERPGYGLNTQALINDSAFFGLTLTGYTFKGWNSQKDGLGTLFDSTNTTIQTLRKNSENNKTPLGESEVTLYAQWAPNKYKIYYCGNGADSHTYTSDVIHGNSNNHTCENYNYCNPEEYEYDTSIELKLNRFVRTGHTFIGWSTVPNPGRDDIIYPDTAFVENLSAKDGDIVYLYAQWVPAQFYYNANYNGLSTQVGNGYTLNSKDDVCDIAGNRLCYDFIGSEINIRKPEEFGLGIENYGFVGWSKDKEGTSILTPDSHYTIQEILAYFGTFTTDKVPLYAIWSQRDVSFSYNVGTNYVKGTTSLRYDVDSNGFITSNNNRYKDFFYNPEPALTTSIRGIEDFALIMDTSKGDYVFDRWVARKNIDGIEYYLDNTKTWKPFIDENNADYNPYLFKNNEIIEYNPSSVSFEDLFGEELYGDDANVCFYAKWKEKLEYTVNIVYNVGNINNEWLHTTSPLYVDSNNLICINDNNDATNDVYTETFYFSKNDATLLTTNANIGEIFVKNVDGTGFDISYDYHKFAGWTTVSPGKNYLSNIMTTNNKNDLMNKKSVTIVLTAAWVENILSVHYNTNGGIVSESYALDEKDNVLESKNSNKIITYTYNAVSSNIRIDNCENKYGFNKTGNVLYGYIVGNETIEVAKAIETVYSAVELAPEIKYGDVELTIFAKWTPNVVNIIYNANNGVVNSDNYFVNVNTDDICSGNDRFKQTVEYNDSVNILSNDYFSLTHNACKFVGWNTAIDGSGTVFEPNKAYTIFDYVSNIHLPTQEITLYAQWEPESYHVYYCGNGADGEGYTNYLSNLKDGDADYGSVFNKNNFKNHHCGSIPCDSIGNYYHNKEWKNNEPDVLADNLFTKTGYVFAGYWTDKDGNQYSEGVAVENLPVDENGVIFLYAQWTPISYIIEYDGNGATEGLVPSQELLYDQIGKLNNNVFVKDYYHSPENCWIASREINGTTYYCVSYNKNTHATVWKPENSININVDAYKFNENEEVAKLTSVNNDIITMHAIWAPNKLIITYNTNGGIVSENEFDVNDNDFITKDNIVYEHTYIYNDGDTSINIKGSNFFGLVRESTGDTYSVFNGWALDKTAYIPDYTNKNLTGISIEQLAPELKYENVKVELYAMWNEVDEIVLTYYEGELVTKDKLTSDFKNTVPFPNAYFEIGTADGAPFLYPSTISGFKPSAEDYGNYNTDGLYTYFEKLNKDETIKIIHSFWPNAAIGEKELFFFIDIIYNNPPEITACDRWYTLEEALSGKITKQDLLKTAIAEDIESGNINHLLNIVDFDTYKFDQVGEYQITYTVTDDIPVEGKNKATTKTVTIHITDSYANEKVRFISENYYPLISNLYVDAEGNYKAKKVNGILYYLNAESELCVDVNGNPFPVDAGLTAKTLINADGTYTVIPLSKWYRNNECVTSLQECLNNKKDNNGNWNHVEEIWTFSSEEIKAIRENLKNNVYDENFYANQYVNGNCISVTKKSEISQTYDIGQNQLDYLSINGSVVNGFNTSADEDLWHDTFAGYLVIPKNIAVNSEVVNITTIKSQAFAENEKISAVRIPSSVAEIERYAFENCPNLKVVYIEAKQEEIIIYENSFDQDVVIKYI